MLRLLLDVLSVNYEEDESLFFRNFVLREREYFPGSTGIHFLLSIGMIFDEEPVGSLLCGFSFAFAWLTKSFASNCNA